MAEPPAPDPFARLRGLTPARIGLGRAGQGLPTRAMLEFQLAHARARDAVHAALDAASLAEAIGGGTITVASAAADRQAYLLDPEAGRRLAEATPALPRGDHDLAIVVADGLSATAGTAHAAPLVRLLRARLGGWRVGPVVIATQARVALGDPIGAALGARAVVVLIGERPGLSAADSLGAYLTWAPRPGRLDSERNCVSNIRPGGLALADAATRIAWLLEEARRLGLTGTALKDRSAQAALGPPAPTVGD